MRFRVLRFGDERLWFVNGPDFSVRGFEDWRAGPGAWLDIRAWCLRWKVWLISSGIRP